MRGRICAEVTRSPFTPTREGATVVVVATTPLTIRQLIAELERLEELSGIERAQAVRGGGRRLGDLARAAISAAGDEAIWQAKRRGMSYKEITAALGYSDDGPVSRAISDHNRRSEAHSPR